ncbi:MAG: NAD-dependent epimerase/dehydratase family protein [Planctomycetes bacterium]|nr:NAD-dependent epimerase/dehydratase family protein [Planctomycetota bacterium]MBI3843843.1 NAD-dependent epimerase/dehydratase family protein [Planctomycetota bacterium]
MDGRILVTGAAGLAGSHLVRRLHAGGRSVRALVRPRGDLARLEGLPVEIVEADVRDAVAVARAMRGVEIVVHAAASFRREGVARSEFTEVNRDAVGVVIRAARGADVRRVVHVSTVGVHGAVKRPPADENAPLEPGDAYQRSKLEGEIVAREEFAKGGMQGVIVRPVGVYGPGDTRFLKMFRLVARGRFVLFGGGRVLYHLTYVEDLAAGLELAALHPAAAGETFILGGPEFVTLETFARLVADAVGARPPRLKLPVWPLTIAGAACEAICRPLGIEPPIYRRRVDFFRKDRAFSIEKARRLLGYSPTVSLADGLRRTADWYRSRNLL